MIIIKHKEESYEALPGPMLRAVRLLHLTADDLYTYGCVTTRIEQEFKAAIAQGKVAVIPTTGDTTTEAILQVIGWDSWMADTTGLLEDSLWKALLKSDGETLKRLTQRYIELSVGKSNA